MRTCYWCGIETPVVRGAPWLTLTQTGALVPCDVEDADAALCLDCLAEVRAILQAHAWDVSDEDDYA